MSEEQKKDDEPPKIPDTLPVLPLRDIVIFPFMIVPLYVSRDRSIKAVDQALADNRMILLAAQKRQDDEDPGHDDIYPVGTVALIMRMLKLPDGRIRVLVQGIGRARITGFEDGHPHLQAKVEQVTEGEVKEKNLEVEALMRNVKAALEKSANLGKPISPEVIVIATNMEEPGRLADLTASNLDLKVEGAQEILEAVDPLERLRRVHELMAKELEVLAMQQEISTQAKGEMDRSQREFFLRQQLKAIQSELGEGNELGEEIAALKEKAQKARIPKPVMEEVERQLKKLERMHPDSAETATLRNWLDWMVTLPWGKATKDNLDLVEAQRILDEDHYGLEKVKERIVEYLAVRKLKEKMKGPLLCFVGPPGVGKTSLGRSIARALGRKFVRLSLGGVKDEAEIRGHRRTYVGSMPGRIIQGIHQAGSNNPVFMMDEVDKIGADYRGDPSSALLEVLDPEQNNSFRDHYLSVPFDLSGVMFICTANLTDTIQPAFLDRMELIRLSGYTEEEKIEIARRHIVPKQLEEHGLTPENLVIPDKALRTMISGYTREAGLRNLEREVASVARKVARKVAEGHPEPVKVTSTTLHEVPGRAQDPARRAAEGRRRGHRHGPRLDGHRRRRDVHRGDRHEGQGPPHADGVARRRDEGVRPGRALVRAHAGAPVRHQGRVLRHARPARARARGGDPEGRTLGRRHHGDRHHLRADEPPDQAVPGHDRRAHPARQRAADRRAQGEDPRRAPRRHHDPDLPEAEPQGARRDPGRAEARRPGAPRGHGRGRVAAGAHPRPRDAPGRRAQAGREAAAAQGAYQDDRGLRPPRVGASHPCDASAPVFPIAASAALSSGHAPCLASPAPAPRRRRRTR